jgi:hypothetical protein
MSTEVCPVCRGKKYLICYRTEDGRKAVERCDECSAEALTDEDAAALYIAAGGR